MSSAHNETVALNHFRDDNLSLALKVSIKSKMDLVKCLTKEVYGNVPVPTKYNVEKIFAGLQSGTYPAEEVS